MIKKYIIGIFIFIGVTGCIENDIPYPQILGNVESIEIQGTVETPKIDITNRTITFTLSDTVDLRKVQILSLQITPDASSTLDSNAVIDFTNGVNYAIEGPYTFTISTFQDYTWQLIASQPINREIKLSSSIGNASFDIKNHTAIAYVAETQDLYSITVEKCQLAPSNAVYNPDPKTISDFSSEVKIMVSYFDFVEQWTINVQPTQINVITGVASPWSTFAYLNGDVLATSTLQPGFQYRETGTQDWTDIDVEGENGKITTVVTNLKPNTQYEYRAYLGQEFADTETFTTDLMPGVPNLNFDQAYTSGEGSKAVWYFNASGGNSYWATGNEGVTITHPSNTVSVSGGDDAVSGSAVKMVTYNKVFLVQVAAGNIFTGNYIKTIGDDPAKLIESAQMGRPFVGRPTSLRGMFKYQPGVYDSGSHWAAADEAFGLDFNKFNGRNDTCHIYIALEKWPEGADTRPTDVNSIELIGYGEFVSGEQVNNYTEFNIKVEYYNTETKPTHISIVATSSKYGGYFCGAAGSTLYIDDFVLGWDYLGGE